MKTRAQLKAMAKQQIKGNVGTLFIIALLIGLLSGITAYIPIVGTFIVAPALSLSTYRIYLRLTRGTSPIVGDMTSGFDDFWSAFKVTFLQSLYIMLWMCLFCIPGFIKAYSYSQAMYILAENPGMGANEAITRSRVMMYGHKTELFYLHLSFIGWYIFGIITLGIGFFYVIPYMNATLANFYENLKPQSGNSGSSFDTNSGGGDFTVSAPTSGNTGNFDLPENEM